MCVCLRERDRQRESVCMCLVSLLILMGSLIVLSLICFFLSSTSPGFQVPLWFHRHCHVQNRQLLRIAPPAAVVIP